MKSIDDIKKYLKERIKNEKEYMLEYIQDIMKTFSSSDGLYLGGKDLHYTESCFRSYTYHRTRLNELNRIYDDLFGGLDEEE
jgi:hypothetical protein